MDRARTWRSAALGQTLFLTADYHRQRFDKHFHDEFAIGVIDRGCQAFVYDSDRRLDMPEGSVALIAPGVVHAGWSGAKEGWRYRMLYPAAELVRAAARDIFDRPDMATFHRPVVNDLPLSQALSRLHGLSEAPGADGLELERLYFLIVRRAFERHAGIRPGAARYADRRSVAAMRDLLEDDLQAQVSLADLAERSGLSRYQALRHFKAVYGLPPHAFLRQIRVRHAQASIERGDSLAASAASAGFADQAHMTRTFRQTVGYTPGAFAAA